LAKAKTRPSREKEGSKRRLHMAVKKAAKKAAKKPAKKTAKKK
jgi:hypothetical protein